MIYRLIYSVKNIFDLFVQRVKAVLIETFQLKFRLNDTLSLNTLTDLITMPSHLRTHCYFWISPHLFYLLVKVWLQCESTQNSLRCILGLFLWVLLIETASAVAVLRIASLSAGEKCYQGLGGSKQPHRVSHWAASTWASTFISAQAPRHLLQEETEECKLNHVNLAFLVFPICYLRLANRIVLIVMRIM